MKNKIGAATCLDCGYPDCDVALDKNGHPYLVCWAPECNGEQFFTKGKTPKVRSLLERGQYRPITGGPTADELRVKYGLMPAPSAAAGAKKPAPSKPRHVPAAPKPEAPKQAAAPEKKTGFLSGLRTLMDEG